MRKRRTRIVYSPTDLSRFLESRFASWMDRFDLEYPGELEPDPPSEEDELVRRKGHQHEKTVLERLVGEGHDVVDLSDGGDRLRRTSEALGEGRGTVYQGLLGGDDYVGAPDFLVSVAHGYEPLDAKLARSARPVDLVQLCGYADLLGETRGSLPRQLHVVTGDGARTSVRTEDYFYYYLALKDEFLGFMESFDRSAPPVPELFAKHRRWQSRADALLEQLDHPSRVAGITGAQIRRLEEAGITTMEGLAGDTRPRIPRLPVPVFERLRAQARLQVASAGRERPLYDVIPPDPAEPRRGLALLPPPSRLDVFFDMEGYPLGREPLEYLFGATHLDDGERCFVDWWGHDADEERTALAGFVDWVAERRRRDPSLHVFHYGHYETTAIKRLMGCHGTREREVDELLRDEVFVDLHQVVRHGLRVGEPRYSIKNLERLFRDARDGEVGTAVDSIVFYQRWLDSGEPRDWRRSPILRQIRDYNKDDCDSTLMLVEWLRERQREAAIVWAGPARDSEEKRREPRPEVAERERLAATLIERARSDRGTGRDELLGQLLEFHRREDRPMWWAAFERHGMSEDQLIEDVNCLGGLRRVSGGERRTNGVAYEFDPDQDTKLKPKDSCYLSHDLDASVEIVDLDLDAGSVTLRLRPPVLARIGGTPPRRLSLIPKEYLPADVITASIGETARRLFDGEPLAGALEDLLARRAPRIRGRRPGPLIEAGETPLEAALRLIPAMDGTTLSIQGPPGSGKTTTAARVIVELLDRGCRVGISSNSHKAILNLMRACAAARDWRLSCLKVGGDDDELFRRCRGARQGRSSEAAGLLQVCPLIGGTAWLFSRRDMEGRLDYLFVDEAGQVSMANLVGISRSARNLVLVGDQMQLPQPIQGDHPGRSGQSSLDYLLGDRPTVADDAGLFLGTTFRLHPRLCEFISGAFYEGRLRSAEACENRVVRIPEGDPGDRLVRQEAGIVFVPVEHEGNTQASAEEVEVVARIVDELVGREHTGLDGEVAGRLDTSQILVVAPYNLQVRRLGQRLPSTVRVGTVDKFQGQEAPVVIVSMCASEGHGSPRGLDFLLNPNRLNVAISRARSLAVVVGHPGLAQTRCTRAEQMKLLNLYCRITRKKGSF